MKKNYQILTLLLLTLLFSSNSNAQIFDKLLKKAEKSIEDKLQKKVKKTTDKAADDILNGKNPVSKKAIVGGDNRPKLSELKDSDFIQNETNPLSNPENTRYRVAKNLFIDIKGKYPNGYMPKWRFINYSSKLNFTEENWINPKSNTSQESKQLSIVDYNGKATLRIKAHINCECYADIVIKDSVSVLTKNQQTYELKNFRRILNDRSTGEPCVSQSNGWLTSGGWAGKITLSANENGDLLMDLMLELYSSDHKTAKEFKPSQVAYRYIANGITIENEMSAEKSNEIIRKEKEAKEKQKEYLANCKKQLDDVMKTIKQKYPQKECRECYIREKGSSLKVTPTKTLYSDGYGNVYSESGTDWDINTKLYIKNKCNYKLTFIGIQQLYDEERGYYFKDVSCTLDANYEYYVEQGMFSSLLSSMIGNNSDIILQKEYNINNAYVNSIQWIKVIK